MTDTLTPTLNDFLKENGIADEVHDNTAKRLAELEAADLTQFKPGDIVLWNAALWGMADYRAGKVASAGKKRLDVSDGISKRHVAIDHKPRKIPSHVSLERARQLMRASEDQRTHAIRQACEQHTARINRILEGNYD